MNSKYIIALMCCAIPYAECAENQNECVLTKEFAKALLPDENGVLVVPEKYTEISDYAFQFRRDIKSLVISNSVTSIGEDAFCACHKLSSINIQDSVKTIEKNAFRWCFKLKSINLYSDVDRINWLLKNAGILEEAPIFREKIVEKYYLKGCGAGYFNVYV